MDWPLFDLRLSIADVALRPVIDPDLPAVAAMFPDDDEQDPRWEHFAGLSAPAEPSAAPRAADLAPPRELVAVVVVPGPGSRGVG